MPLKKWHKTARIKQKHFEFYPMDSFYLHPLCVCPVNFIYLFIMKTVSNGVWIKWCAEKKKKMKERTRCTHFTLLTTSVMHFNFFIQIKAALFAHWQRLIWNKTQNHSILGANRDSMLPLFFNGCKKIFRYSKISTHIFFFQISKKPIFHLKRIENAFLLFLCKILASKWTNFTSYFFDIDGLPDWYNIFRSFCSDFLRKWLPIARKFTIKTNHFSLVLN